MVRRVMEHVVTDVTKDEAAKNRRRELAENQDKKPIKQNRQRDAYDWRHYERAGVVRIIIMDAMNYEVQKFFATALRFVMKDVTSPAGS